MTKLQVIVLKGLFPQSTDAGFLAAIQEVVEATGNVEVAIEKLAGIYEIPCLFQTSPKNYTNGRGNVNLQATGVNHFTDELTFTYQECEGQWGFVPKGQPVPHLKSLREEFVKTTAEKAARLLEIELTEFKELYEEKYILGDVKPEVKTGRCQLKDWQ